MGSAGAIIMSLYYVWILTLPASLGGGLFADRCPCDGAYPRAVERPRIPCGLFGGLGLRTGCLQFQQPAVAWSLDGNSLGSCARTVRVAGGIGQAGIADLCDQIAQIAGIANGAFHALVGDHAADHQLFDA